MKKLNFFNLDCHISVIADLKNIFESLGHSVNSWSISGHNWIFNRPPSNVDVINSQTWKNLDKDMCEKYWSKQIGLNRENFTKSIVIQGRHKTRRVQYGICTLNFSSRFLEFFNSFFAIQKNIIKLNISMNNGSAMDMCKSICDLFENKFCI